MQKKTRHEATVATTRSRKRAGEPLRSEVDEVTKVPIDNIQDVTHAARVRVEGSITRNLGDFESLRIGICIEWPCEPTAKALDKTYAFLSREVDERIQDELVKAGLATE